MIVMPLSIVEMDIPGNREFMETLYNDFCSMMKLTAWNVCRSWAMVEDIIQEALVRLIRKVNTLRGLVRPALASYVAQTVRHTALNHLTRDQRRRYYGEWQEVEATEYQTPETLYFQKEDQQNLKRAVATLRERDRDLLNFKYNLELSNKEIGKAMGLTSKDVSWYICLARRRALRAMEGLGYETN